jgi:hypothetical protein
MFQRRAGQLGEKEAHRRGAHDKAHEIRRERRRERVARAADAVEPNRAPGCKTSFPVEPSITLDMRPIMLSGP